MSQWISVDVPIDELWDEVSHEQFIAEAAKRNLHIVDTTTTRLDFVILRDELRQTVTSGDLSHFDVLMLRMEHLIGLDRDMTFADPESTRWK